VAEAIPGVPTPLGWTLQRYAVVLGARGGFADMGVLPEDQVARPVGTDEALAIFHGHAAGNVDALLRVAAAMPGNSAAALLEQLFGAAGDAPVTVPPRSAARWPVIAAKLPANLARAPGRIDAAGRAAAGFRPAALARLADPARARPVLAEARDLFAAVVRPHAFVTFVAQGLYEKVAQLAGAAGRPGAELALVGGYGGMEETALASDLWDLAHGRTTLDAFLADYGHHGPNEGELSSRSWRENPAPLLLTMETIRRLDPDDHPRRVEARARRSAWPWSTRSWPDSPGGAAPRPACSCAWPAGTCPCGKPGAAPSTGRSMSPGPRPGWPEPTWRAREPWMTRWSRARSWCAGPPTRAGWPCSSAPAPWSSTSAGP
jgi:pyruvate,water dikinase